MSMSKTSEENSVKETLARYWKRSVALVTAWLRRYQDDPFFRTEINAIALQVVFAIFIVAIVGTSLSLLSQDVSQAIVSGIKASLSTTSPASVAPSIMQELQTIRMQNLAIVITLIII